MPRRDAGALREVDLRLRRRPDDQAGIFVGDRPNRREFRQPPLRPRRVAGPSGRSFHQLRQSNQRARDEHARRIGRRVIRRLGDLLVGETQFDSQHHGLPLSLGQSGDRRFVALEQLAGDGPVQRRSAGLGYGLRGLLAPGFPARAASLNRIEAQPSGEITG